MAIDPKLIDVTTVADSSSEGQGDLMRSLKREIKTLKQTVITQDIRIFEMQALLQSGKGLSNIMNLSQLLDTFMAVVRERYDVVNSSVLLREDSEGNSKTFFQVKRFYGLDDFYVDERGRREPLYLFRLEQNNGLLWNIIQQGNVVSVRDLQKEPRFVTAWEKTALDYLRSDFWCPLIKSGEVIGILTLGEKRDGSQVTEADYSFVQELASIASTIIDSTLKYEKNQRILSNIQILYDVHQELANINDYKQLCFETIRNAVMAVKAQKGNLMLLNKTTNRLELTRAWGHIDGAIVDAVNAGRIETKSFEIGEGIAGQAALIRKPIVVNNRDEIPQMGGYDTFCICSIPVMNGNQLEGVMNFTNKVQFREDGTPVSDTLGRFTKEDVSLLQGIADQSAVSLNKSRLYSASITDRLTGLHNARYFEDTFYEMVTQAAIENAPLTIGIVDIDFFKKFNDNHGHRAGDFILKQVGALMEQTTRQGTSDHVYRYGGEEFCFVLPRTEATEAVLILEEFRRLVESKTFNYEGTNLSVTLSIGVAQTILHSNDPRQLFNLADEALYQAKKDGRNQVRLAAVPPAPAQVVSEEQKRPKV